MEHTTPDRPDLDRRTLIRRAGVVTAGVAAWSSPAITTLATSAHATGSPAPPCTNCNPICGAFTQCGPTCFCVPKVDGTGCVCHPSSICSSLQRCTTQADCTTGTCANTCCGAVCVPDCTNVLARQAAPADGERTTTHG